MAHAGRGITPPLSLRIYGRYVGGMLEWNEKPISIASRVLADGRLVELVRPRDQKKTLLSTSDEKGAELVETLDADGERLVPIPASNSLIKNNAIVLPEGPEPYGDITSLVDEVERYFDRYVSLSSWFRQLAAYYVLFTWVYDAFEELPYLRLQADFGSGKTRALLVIGSLCYRAFFASGASTVSPIFHSLDTFRGTLILDEADFRFSDQTAELVKVLNNGHVRGFPVFRTAITAKREFDPRAFHVYGPKIIAMRRSFEDEALESRFITEHLDRVQMRPDVPINLPAEQRVEAQTLRNKLLQYRFDHRSRLHADEALVDPTLSPRTNQILVPLLSIVPDESAREAIRMALREHEQLHLSERATSTAAEIAGILIELMSERAGAPVSVSEVAERLNVRYGANFKRPITARFVGSQLRAQLGIATYKSNGIYMVGATKERLTDLESRFGTLSSNNPA